MNRARASVPPEAIRIEDEVWQEAFRETTRSRARPHLRSLDGGRAAGLEAPRFGGSRGAGREVPRPVRARTATASTRRVIPGGRAAMPSGRSTASRPLPVDAPLVETPEPAWTPPEPPGRRTVTITGRGAERNMPWPTEASRRRASRRVHERAGFRPDRFAMWALFLGLLLVLVAATSAHG